MDAAAKLGRNPVRKHQTRPDYGDEQADAGRDCRNRLARRNSRVRTGTGNIHFPCLADHEQDWQPYPFNPYSCCMCDHTYSTYMSSCQKSSSWSQCIKTTTRKGKTYNILFRENCRLQKFSKKATSPMKQKKKEKTTVLS